MSGPLYKTVATLDPAAPRQRLLPLASYPHLRDVLSVPILHIEVVTIAKYWPIVWIPSDGSFEPVAVIGLHPRVGLASRLEALAGDALPLAIKAFPLLLGPSGETGDSKVLIHALPGDRADNEGEAVFDSSGNLTPAATDKSDILWLFAAERAKTRIMTDALVEAGGLDVWKLRYAFEDQSIENQGFYVVQAGFLQDPRYVDLAAEHGPAFVSMVEHHILSRSRVQDLADLLTAAPEPALAEAN